MKLIINISLLFACSAYGAGETRTTGGNDDQSGSTHPTYQMQFVESRTCVGYMDNSNWKHSIGLFSSSANILGTDANSNSPYVAFPMQPNGSVNPGFHFLTEEKASTAFTNGVTRIPIDSTRTDRTYQLTLDGKDRGIVNEDNLQALRSGPSPSFQKTDPEKVEAIRADNNRILGEFTRLVMQDFLRGLKNLSRDPKGADQVTGTVNELFKVYCKCKNSMRMMSPETLVEEVRRANAKSAYVEALQSTLNTKSCLDQ